MAQRDSGLKVSTQICILMQNSRCVTPAALTGNFSKYLPLASKICFFNRKNHFLPLLQSISHRICLLPYFVLIIDIIKLKIIKNAISQLFSTLFTGKLKKKTKSIDQ